MSKGVLIVFSGPSGCGKGTVLNEYLKNRDSNVFISVSATTRAPREGEVNGKHYHFITTQEFENKIENDGMLEHAQYCGNYYGTPRDEVYNHLENGDDVILEIEVQGALQIREKCPEAVQIFVAPPSMEELKNRLIGRGTEDIETINKRIATAYEEMKLAYNYDFVVVNDTVEAASARLNTIVEANRCNKNNMKNFLDEVIKNG